MTVENTPLCLVPARGGSQRLKRKNIVSLCGLPLIAYTIRVAKETGLFDEVYVSTDDPEIGEVARNQGATVPYLRPHHLATASASLVDVSLHMIDHLNQQGRRYSELCLLMPTSPLREVEDISESYRVFQSTGSGFLMSVTRYVMGSPYWALWMDQVGHVEPVFGLEHFADTHDSSHLYCPSGVVRWAGIGALRRERTFYGSGVVGYEVPPIRAVEVDEIAGFQLVEALMLSQRSVKRDTSQVI